MESIQKSLLLKNVLYCILLGTVLLSLIIPFHVDFRLGKKNDNHHAVYFMLRLCVLQALQGSALG